MQELAYYSRQCLPVRWSAQIFGIFGALSAGVGDLSRPGHGVVMHVAEKPTTLADVAAMVSTVSVLIT